MKILVNFMFLLLLLMNSSFAQTAQEPTATETSAAEQLQAIPKTEITKQADEAGQQIQILLQDLTLKPEVTAFEADISMTLDSLKKLRQNDIYQKLAEQNLRVLSSLDNEWSLYASKLENWQGDLSAGSQAVEQMSKKLKELEELWRITQEKASKEKAPRAILNRTSAILNDIKGVQKQVQTRLNGLLVLQNQISQNLNDINELRTRIDDTESEMRGQLFVRDSPPLWEGRVAEEDSLQIASQFQKSWSEMIRSNLAFFNLNKDRFYIHLVLLVFLIASMYYLYTRNKREQLFDTEDDSLKHSAYFVSRPISAAILIALFLSVWIYPESTVTVGEFIMLLLLFPVLRLVPGIFKSEIHIPVYILAGLFFIDLLQKNAVGFVFFQRVLLLLASVAALATLIWMIVSGRISMKKGVGFWINLIRRLTPVIMLMLLVALIGNMYGSVSLAATFTWGIVESSHILVTVYIAAVVASGLVTVIIRRRRAQAMQFIKTYAHNIERWAKIVIYVIAFMIWVRATLRFFGFWKQLQNWYAELLGLEWTVGTVVISLNAIIDFILIILGTFILTRFVRVFMDLQLFPHLKLPKGLPGAITMMIRYLLIGLGIFLALSSIGIDIGKFGLLAGALGVGLGFGLQKIVANFISSLILAFNQSIRVGDTVQYNDVIGSVKEIGVNASIIRTFEGSDVIIPNADLISNSVTNWTFTDAQRRMQLPVKVAYGYDPHTILELLEKTAREHEYVLNMPEPFAVFNGFGEYYLDFTLYYWISSSLFFKAKTGVALAVHDEIKKAGIQTPRPQRDLKLSMDDDVDKKSLTGAKQVKTGQKPRKSQQGNKDQAGK